MAEKRQEGINIAPISRDGQTAEKRVPPPISLAVNRWKILVLQRCLFTESSQGLPPEMDGMGGRGR